MCVLRDVFEKVLERKWLLKMEEELGFSKVPFYSILGFVISIRVKGILVLLFDYLRGILVLSQV